MMRRFAGKRFLLPSILLLAGALLTLDVATQASLRRSPNAGQPDRVIEIRPLGPTQEILDAEREALPSVPEVAAELKGSRYLQLSFELVDDHSKLPSPKGVSEQFRSVFFDYSRNRALIVTGVMEGSSVEITETQVQPEPGDDEFEAAVALLRKDPHFGPMLRMDAVRAYPPMPPLVNGDLPVRRVERTLAVGLIPTAAKSSVPAHEIVGVNMIRRTVERYPGGAPKGSVVAPSSCGLPGAGQGTTARGTAGQFEVVINRGSAEIWRFRVIRPAASSGTRGSGVELRDVDFKGKRVLARAHVPILNVQYANNGCGPFRDWQWQEGAFLAEGVDVAPGIRSCTHFPETIIDSGTDFGNFRGVAVFDDGREVRLVTEMNAGWYRYISEWRFSDEGIIKPRFGFDGVQNSCVCIAHNHHAYFRLDFDLRTAENHVVFENTIFGSETFQLEQKKLRTPGFMSWVVRNSLTGESVVIVPGRHDGVADTYGRGDLWVLQFKSNEIDDGVNCTGGSSCPTEANLDAFVNGESVFNRDVVVWYAVHFLHDHEDQHSHFGNSVLGPDLIIAKW